MFEDSLVESTGRIRTRSRRYAAGSFVLEAAILAVVIAIPYLYPAALPRQALLTPLAAPPPPSEPAPVSHMAVIHQAQTVRLIDLTVPKVIPNTIARGGPPEPISIGEPFGHGPVPIPGALQGIGPAFNPPVVVRAKPSGPIRVSAGVAAGQLLTPIQPVYPVIAKVSHVQGTVVIDAVISKDGTVEQARVVSGSPLLAQAALSAVSRARYRPYRLSGQPIAVETTIRIIFTLGE